MPTVEVEPAALADLARRTARSAAALAAVDLSGAVELAALSLPGSSSEQVLLECAVACRRTSDLLGSMGGRLSARLLRAADSYRAADLLPMPPTPVDP